MSNWFENWFNSPYYHILYKNRDDVEAEYFMQNLITFLKLKSDTKVLDLACGKGRHAVFLNKKGLDVTGIDLSKESIVEAQKIENKNLHFYVQDMRLLFRTNYFDCVFNLFTSFGYFNHNDNIRVLKAVNKNLKKDGYFVLDFFNAEIVKNNLVALEYKTVDLIDFTIEKKIENNCIIKQIKFTVNNEEKLFKEKVELLSKNNLEQLLLDANFSISNYFGDYNLSNFEIDKSPRLIIIARKK